jgi:putative DNA primase/helicase
VTASSTAATLGGHQGNNGWWNARCPICQGDGKLGIRDTANGLALHCFRGCTRGEIDAEIRRRGIEVALGGTFAEIDPEELARRQAADEAHRRHEIARAQWIWDNDTRDHTETTAIAAYFGSRRLLDPVPATIRYQYGSVTHKRPHAMVARIDHAVTGPMGIHVTFLRPDGEGKTDCAKPRIVIGTRSGGSVHLADPQPDQWHVIAEGIESTMSAMQATGYPGWAALCADGIKALVLPPSIRRVIIAADNDASGVGQRAAHKAAHRWLAEGRAVKIAMPPVPGDWNDALMGRIPARIEGARYAA